jgi:hypothetical protein
MSTSGTDGHGYWYLKESIHSEYHSCVTFNIGLGSNQEQVVNKKVRFQA